MPRRLIGTKPLTVAERVQRHRAKVRAKKRAVYEASPDVEVWCGLEIRKIEAVLKPLAEPDLLDKTLRPNSIFAETRAK